MVLVNSSTSAAARHAPELMSSSSGATPFAGVRFHGFHLCLELHGDDMDGVLASVTLDDLSVHQVRQKATCFAIPCYSCYCCEVISVDRFRCPSVQPPIIDTNAVLL